MSDLIRWSETNVGKYSMFDVELGGIKTTISCDTENSKNLISLLKELEHINISQNEELKDLRKQIKSSVILSEAEKSTLALMREQIDDLLGVEQPTSMKSLSNEHHYSVEPVWGYEFVNIIRACKILGFTRKEVGEYFHMNVYAFLKEYDLKFDDLCGPSDYFYNIFFNKGLKSRKERKVEYNFIQKNNILEELQEKSINDIAKKYNVSAQIIWAYCITQSHDFIIVDCDNITHMFCYDLEPRNLGYHNTYRYIDAKGGIDELKKLKRKGYKQYEIALMWGIKPSSISQYIVKRGEKWSAWPVD